MASVEPGFESRIQASKKLPVAPSPKNQRLAGAVTPVPPVPASQILVGLLRYIERSATIGRSALTMPPRSADTRPGSAAPTGIVTRA